MLDQKVRRDICTRLVLDEAYCIKVCLLSRCTVVCVTITEMNVKNVPDISCCSLLRRHNSDIIKVSWNCDVVVAT